jgi:hypothetical protein
VKEVAVDRERALQVWGEGGEGWGERDRSNAVRLKPDPQKKAMVGGVGQASA